MMSPRRLLLLFAIASPFAIAWNAPVFEQEPSRVLANADAGTIGASSSPDESDQILAAIKTIEDAKANNLTPTLMAIAGLIAIALKHLIDFLQGLKASELTDKAKAAIPWVLMIAGLVTAILTKYAAGQSWTNAIVLGGAAPGATLWHELFENLKTFLYKKPAAAPAVPPPVPPEAKQGGFVEPVALVALLVMSLACLGLAWLLQGCSGSQQKAWGDTGAAILKNCANLGNAEQVVSDIETDARQPGATAQSVATAVAIKDGIELALCAFEQIVANGGALLGAKETTAHQRAYEAAQWGLAHKDELRAKAAQAAPVKP